MSNLNNDNDNPSLDWKKWYGTKWCWAPDRLRDQQALGIDTNLAKERATFLTRDDPTVEKRFQAHLLTVKALDESNPSEMAKAVHFFNEALEQNAKNYPAPIKPSSAVLACLLGNEQLFKDQQWTAGHYWLYDFLLTMKGELKPLRTESTPLLLASYQQGILAKLVMEAIPGGPHGLVYPDFWSMGLITFAGEKNNNFLKAMMEAMHYTCNTAGHNEIRLRWRIEPWENGSDLSRIEGASGQVAAACCTKAILETREFERDLLNDKMVVTAQLGEGNSTSSWEDRKIAPILDLPQKLRKASEAGMTAVILADGQQSSAISGVKEGEYQDTLICEGKSIGRSLLVQEVINLDQAYQSLLITSRYMKQYANEICGRNKTSNEIAELRRTRQISKIGWFDIWDEQPTPAQYKKQTQEA